MARKRDEVWHTMNPTESAKAVARLMEVFFQRDLAHGRENLMANVTRITDRTPALSSPFRAHP